ncbi:T9SS type A sorting domain-containing protein [candidate division KSB1 bacterium]|nr:T9SS type A sorting domain-containing protein [candidate division KSB1 bacterium]
MSGFPDLDPFIDDYIIREYGETKVGIFGLTTEQTNIIAHPEPVVITDASAAAMAMVDTLTAKDCDVIIALTHIGDLLDMQLAATVPGIDIIIGGHSHTLIPEPMAVPNMSTGDTTVIVQADWAGTHVGKLTVEVSDQKVKMLDYQMIPVDETVPAEPATAAMLNGLIAMIEADPRYGPAYTAIIAEAAAEHPKELNAGEFKDTKLGDLITDALRDTADTDIAFAANGFIRQNIFPGNLMAADMFQVLPEGLNPETGYGSGVSKFQISGLNIIVGLEFSVAMIEYEDTFFLNVSGLTFDFNSTNPAGSRVDATSIRINGAPVDPQKLYSVAINSDLVGMLSLTGIDTIYNVEPVASSEFLVFKNYIVKNSPIDHPGGERIRDVAKTSVASNDVNAAKAQSYFLERNYPNPFNPTTTISYSVPQASEVRISIFNTLGQEIRVLTDSHHEAGVYKLSWDGRDYTGQQVSSGIYFSRLKAGNVVMARRMILAK